MLKGSEGLSAVLLDFRFPSLGSAEKVPKVPMFIITIALASITTIASGSERSLCVRPHARGPACILSCDPQNKPARGAIVTPTLEIRKMRLRETLSHDQVHTAGPLV